MKEKTVFSNAVVYWVIVAVLVVGLLLSCYVLTKRINVTDVARLIWMAALLFMVVAKHKYALINLKWWLVITMIVGPALSLVGRFLNETMDDSSYNIEFYLYRILMVIIDLIMLNYIRNTITVEKVDMN
ncbi:hypothetical protein [Hymenobacter yonginensis]|uniref:DUF2304 domain-containing protein n=1 Tax=Hymenobacter yonginensis TaxID=748197 RepID=A0ABY7PIP7_9BACT|nr:hypothetical protein [Hymenobacter yonginensis]WBO83210.1 hypothetical protein O9Z63_12555 [Hymenobacter yonginensis]